MKKLIISLIAATAWSTVASATGVGDLQQNAPDRYTVVRGDTLWSIAARYLKDPWRWPELWSINSQIRNPHWIYPGDVLVLDRSGARPQLRVATRPTVSLTPKIRIEPRQAQAVPPIPADVIAPFLSKPLVVGRDELDTAPRIVATEESRVVLGVGDIAYVQGLPQGKGGVWQVFRRGDALVDPDSHATLGYAAIYLGEARVRQAGPISTIEITRAVEEIYQGDQLLPASAEAPNFGYVPHAPTRRIAGRIMSGYGTLMESGPLSVVAISKGSKDGLEPGHVLAIKRNAIAQRTHRNDPLWGRTGPTGSDSQVVYYPERLTPRDGPLYPRPVAITTQDVAKFPTERYGLVMVFRTFDHVAFGLVMQATRPVAALDTVTNP